MLKRFELADQTFFKKSKREVRIVGIAMPGDVRACEKEIEKIGKQKAVKDEVARLWNMRRVIVIPIVVGALRVISKRFEKFVREVGIYTRVKHVQKTALSGTARI